MKMQLLQNLGLSTFHPPPGGELQDSCGFEVDTLWHVCQAQGRAQLIGTDTTLVDDVICMCSGSAR